jgi:hypothetical protein
MSDRELLELAAKAAGMNLTENGVSNIGECEWLRDGDGGSIYCKNPNGSQTRWNPLASDGDALRLAVKLDMVVTVNRVDEWTQVKCGYLVADMKLTNEPHRGDPYAATRRAIVRAAAEIGRAMK